MPEPTTIKVEDDMHAEMIADAISMAREIFSEPDASDATCLATICQQWIYETSGNKQK